ncbi:MAG: hypothetical protein KatS3mg011_0988 [Acidimicrobiia bacterium]|nr:MAG: hypothetical protein KatS3mg011_0988 [Acidimicrobiia bacterium]
MVARRRAAPVSAAAFKVAAGALEHTRIAGGVFGRRHGADLGSGKGCGRWVSTLGATGPLFGLDLLAEPVALVLGAEVGLHRLVRDRCQVLAAIPVLGTGGEPQHLGGRGAGLLRGGQGPQAGVAQTARAADL